MIADPVLPGFKITLHQVPAALLKPEDAYLCAIYFMYNLALAGWDDYIPSGYEAISKEVNGVKIGFESLAKPADQYQLQIKHMVLGLLKMLNTSASKGVFCFTAVNLYLYRKHIGQMAIGQPVSSKLASATPVNVTLDGMNHIGNFTESRRRGLGVKKQIVDPEDPNFVISYEVVGDPIPCQVLLNAALNGIATSAIMDSERRCINFAGFSSMEEVTFAINGLPLGPSRRVLTYIMVRTALKLLPARLYGEGTCGEVNFSFDYGGESLGAGFIRLSDFSSREKVSSKR